MNNVTISGRLVKTPIANKTHDSYSCNFTLALIEYPKSKNTNYINCVAWGNDAINLAKYQRQGDLIEVSGFLFVTDERKNDKVNKNSKDTKDDKKEKKDRNETFNTDFKVSCESISYLAKSKKNEGYSLGQKILDEKDARISYDSPEGIMIKNISYDYELER